MRKMKQVVGVVVLMMAILFPYTDSGAIASVYSVNTAEAGIELYFSGTGAVGTATGAIDIIGKPGTDKIKGTMKLYKITSRAEIFIKSWDVSAKGRFLDACKSCSVSRGKYKLIYSVKVYRDGVAETIKRDLIRSYT